MKFRRNKPDTARYPQLMVPDAEGDGATAIYVPEDSLPIVSYLLNYVNRLQSELKTMSNKMLVARIDFASQSDKLKDLQSGLADVNERLMIVEGDEYEDKQ